MADADVARLKELEERIKGLEAQLESYRAYERVPWVQKRHELLLSAISRYVYTVTLNRREPVSTIHSPQCLKVTGYASHEYEDDKYLWYRMVYSEDRRVVLAQIDEVLAGKTPAPLEHRIIHKDGTIRWIRNTIVPLYDEKGEMISYDGVIEDISARKKMEEDSEKLIAELKYALARIKTLHGLLPICANCKKVRDDKGYWKQIEEYVRDHSDAEFSHSLCPECAKELYSDYLTDKT